MTLFHLIFIVAVIATSHPLIFANAQDLTAVECQARLPTGRYLLSTLYDEDDTIYIFGGYTATGNVFYRHVFKYSIRQDTIEPAGIIPENSVGGSTIMDKHNNIFHFGTYYSANIFQYFPDIKNFTNVASLPSSDPAFGTIKVDENTALLFGGAGAENRLLSLDLNSLQSTRLPNLPLALAGSRLGVIWVDDKGEAYIFRDEDGALGKFNRLSGQFQVLPNFFPSRWSASKAVWDGEFGYLVGGFGNDVPSETIIQFDPKTEAVRFIKVEGYPAGDTSEFGQTSAVYVEKLNRIYMFGGLTRSSGSNINRHEIWYISLNPIRTPTPTPTSTTTSTTPIPPTEEPTTETPPTTEEPTTEAPSTTKEPTTEASSPITDKPTTEAPPETTTIVSTTEHSGSTTTPRPPHLCPVDDPMEPPNDQCDPDEPFPTYLPYPYDCTKFFQCANGMAVCQRCSNGTIWSQEDKVCVRNGTIPCDPPTTTPRQIVVNEYSIINFIRKYFF